MVKAIEIQWDAGCPSDLERLPKEMEIPNELIDDIYDPKEDNVDDVYDAISDYISDETGFCHEGFELSGMTENAIF